MPGGASALTATLIPSLPYSDADTVPTTAGLWYKYIATTTGPNEISIFAYAATLTTQRLRIFSPDAITPFPWQIAPQVFATSRPFQIPVVAGVTYYFNVYNQVGAYTFSVIAGPNDLAPIGSIFVNDSDGGLPLALLSGTDGHALRFIHPFPPGETADVIASGPHTGRMLVHNRSTQTGDTNNIRGDGHLHLYSPQFVLLADLPYITTGDSYTCPIRVGLTTKQFYVGQQTDLAHGGSSSATTVTSAGAFGPRTWVLTGIGIGHIAPSVDETILYCARLSSGAVRILGRWDLVNDVGLADLAATVTNFRIDALLVLADDTVLVAYTNQATNVTPFVRRYAPDGTILNTYTLTGAQSGDLRLATALDDPASFWIWTKTNAVESLVAPTTLNRFQNLRVSDGAVLSTFSVPQFIKGVYIGAKSATPLARFDAAESCPFLITRVAVPPYDPNPCPCPADPLTLGLTPPSSDPGASPSVDPWTFGP